MTWYAAHLILYVQLKKRQQDHFPIWENIVLIGADSKEEALAKAERRGHEDEGDCHGSFRWDGQPATWVFAGVRKLILCQDEDKQPGEGTEITYNEMEVASKEAVTRLAEGRTVAVRYGDLVRPMHQRKKKTKALAGKTSV